MPFPSAYDRAMSTQVMPQPRQQETFRGQAFNKIFDLLGGNNADPAARAKAIRFADALTGSNAETVLGLTPLVGDAMAIRDAREAFKAGNYGQGALLGGLAAMGVIPIAGDLIKKGGDEVLDAALDMSQAARMQRAADQGFDTSRVLYHGTGDDFLEFDALKMGRTDDGWFGKGFYFSPDSNVANQYASGAAPNVKQVYLQADNPYDWRANEGAGMRLGTPEERFSKTREIMDAGYDSVDVYDEVIKIPEGGSLTDEQWIAVVKSMMSNGGIVLPREMVESTLKRGIKREDFARYYGNELADILPKQRTLLERVVFDPKNIRSVNAVFDPAKRSSANLLASGAGAAVIGSSAVRQNGEKDQ